MARETIASAKRAGAAEIDRLVASHRTVEVELRKIISDKEQALSALRGELAERTKRIDELFKSNNEFEADARMARAETVRLQGALSDAARVIHALGQRAEG